MGMYTQLVVGLDINPKKYPEIKPILEHMIEGKDEPEQLPNHPLFSTSRWNIMLKSESHYFTMKNHSTIRTYDYCDSINITIICDLKNYDNEIKKFIDWITPYLDAEVGEFLGYTRYEENDDPTLIYMRNDETQVSIQSR